MQSQHIDCCWIHCQPGCRMDAAIAELDVKLEQRNQKERDRLEQEREKDKGKKSLAEVNKQNALRNMENALKNVSSRPDGARGLNAEGIDPFSRRPTRPMSYWSTKRRSSATGAMTCGISKSNMQESTRLHSFRCIAKEMWTVPCKYNLGSSPMLLATLCRILSKST